MKYIPTKTDIEWARTLIDAIKDGGVWAAPAAGSIYTVNKRTKTLTRTETLDYSDKTKIHERTKIVFSKIGYNVIDNASTSIN